MKPGCCALTPLAFELRDCAHCLVIIDREREGR